MVVSFNSDFGILKNFLQIILLLPFSKKLIIHIHRSDISYSEKSNFIKYLQKFVLSCSYKIIVLSNELSNNLPLKILKIKFLFYKIPRSEIREYSNKFRSNYASKNIRTNSFFTLIF